MMSYASVAPSFAGYGPWRAIQVETDEAYVWRGMVSGIEILSISDVQAIALAAGKSSRSLGLALGKGLFAIRGVAIEPLGGRYRVEVVLTAWRPEIIPPFWETAEEYGQILAKELRVRWPNIQISDTEYLVIDDDKPKHPALDFWLAHPVLWDPKLASGEGGPTTAWARFEGLYKGSADQGVQLRRSPWPRKSGPIFEESKIPPAVVAGIIGVIAYGAYSATKKKRE